MQLVFSHIWNNRIEIETISAGFLANGGPARGCYDILTPDMADMNVRTFNKQRPVTGNRYQ
jgi:hypothetical protein